MNTLSELFLIEVTADQLQARLHLQAENELNLQDIKFTQEQIVQFLKKHNIVYGINYATIDKLLKTFPETSFPLLVAEGTEAEDGEDGSIEYYFDMTTEVDRSEGWDFREVMRIPTVEEKEKLAKLLPPTKGTDGRTVYGTKILARPGRPARLHRGRNVTFNEEQHIFYSETKGQVSIINHRLHVNNIYEVNESISMKIGNIDFPGTVIIRGDVPTGFTVKASGDIKIFGLVEAATIEAAGTVTISEGIAGLQTGTIKAGENIHVKYINQANIIAENIFVENSILHSQCTANNDIVCHRGNIIGGVVSAGQKIEANNVGNRMNTKTMLSFGTDLTLFEEEEKLKKERSTLQDNFKKIKQLKENFQKKTSDAKSRVTLLRLKNSAIKIGEQIETINTALEKIESSIGNVEKAHLVVRGTIYPNAVVSFGKYKRRIDKEHNFVTITTKDSEIYISHRS